MYRIAGVCILLLLLYLPRSGAQQVLAPGSAKVPVIKDTTLRQLPSLKPAPFRYNYYDHLGAACKAEIRFEKASRIPLRLRLGSLQQTEYLEGKPNAQKP